MTLNSVCSDMSTTMIIFTSLPNFMSLCVLPYSYPETLAYGKKLVFGQDVFDTQGFECTRPNIRKFFLKIMITLLGHLFGKRQRLIYIDVRFYKEARMIIVVNLWLTL